MRQGVQPEEWNGASRLAIPTKEGTTYLCHKGILMLTAEGSYTRLHVTSGESHLLSGNLHKWERRLPSMLFFRCHRAALINLDHVVELRHHAADRSAIVLGGHAVVVSRRYWPRLLAAMKRV